MTSLFIGPADRGDALDKATRTLAEQGFALEERFPAGGMEMLVCRRQGAPESSIVRDGDDLAAVCGTFIFRGRSGRPAVASFLREFTGDWGLLDEAMGPFVLALRRGRALHLATDRAGAYPLFQGANNCFSTSFLALAQTHSRVTLASQESCEYVLSGVPLGDRTMLAEIRKTPLGGVVTIVDGRDEVTGAPSLPVAEDGRSFGELVDVVDERLDSYVAEVLEAYDGRVRCPITGGYDARYVLALLRRRGVTPEVLVYNFHDDVSVAGAVAGVEGLELEVIDPSTLAVPRPEQFSQVARANFLDADGWRQQGIFHNGVEGRLATDRTAGGRAFLTGNGGEVFRNFFMLLDRPYTARQVALAMYGKFHPAILGRPRFDVYVDGIAEKIEALLGRTGRLDRAAIEWLYPFFRCRSWFGRHIALYNRMGPHLMPFYDTRVTALGVTVPVRYKEAGRFEAALIERARPAVAAVRSQYGHSFSGSPPLRRRLGDMAKNTVSPAVRPRLYGGRQRWAAERSAYLSAPFVSAALPDGVVAVGGLLNSRRIADSRQLSRLLSLEYLAQNLACEVSVEWASEAG